LFTSQDFRDNKEMKIACSAVFIAIISFAVHSTEICDDLYSAACAPGENRPADPSGKILSQEEVAQKLNEAREKIRPRLTEIARSELTSNAQFKKAVMKVVRCAKDCERKREQTVVDLLEREAIGGKTPYRDVDLYDIYSLIGEPGFEKISRQAGDEYHLLLTPPQVRKDIEGKFFDRLKMLAKERIDQLQMPDEIRRKILARIDKVGLHAGSCGLIREEQLYPETLSFSGLNDDIRICEAALVKVDSRIALASLILHELGHPFDPCHIADRKNGLMTYILNRPRDAQYPLRDLVNCLRQPESGGAKFNENCGKDQIGEAMSDWFRAEILPRLIAEDYKSMTLKDRRAAYLNAAWRTCVTTRLPEYPSGEIRINALLAVQPEVRDQIGCSRDKYKFKYCDSRAAGQAPPKPVVSEGAK
jgi:hypothetical protein